MITFPFEQILHMKNNGVGWVEIRPKILFDKSKLNCFVIQSSLQSENDGSYQHIKKFSTKVSRPLHVILCDYHKHKIN